MMLSDLDTMCLVKKIELGDDSPLFYSKHHVHSKHHIKNFRARDAIECSDVFLHAGNNPFMLKNSTEHAEPLFIALTVHVY